VTATPELIVAKMENVAVAHANSIYTLTATEFAFSVTTTAEMESTFDFNIKFPEQRLKNTGTLAFDWQVGAGAAASATGGSLVSSHADGIHVDTVKLPLTTLCATTCPVGSYTITVKGFMNTDEVFPQTTGEFYLTVSDRTQSDALAMEGRIDNNLVANVEPRIVNTVATAVRTPDPA